MKKKLIIFDLDGVLINSINNMRMSLKETANYHNLKLNFKIYKKNLGLPFEKIMSNMGIKKNIQDLKKSYIYFSRKNISKIKISKKNLLDLKFLKKRFYLCIYTSKDRSRSVKITNKYKLFDYLLTSDDVKKGKPDPEGIKKIMKKFKTNKENVLYVGDSLYDYKCAKKAGIYYCHASWGYDKLRNFKDISKIKNLKEITKFI